MLQSLPMLCRYFFILVIIFWISPGFCIALVCAHVCLHMKESIRIRSNA